MQLDAAIRAAYETMRRVMIDVVHMTSAANALRSSRR
jgi:hypothetical protein